MIEARHRVVNSPDPVVVVVAGAADAGVSAVADTPGPRGGHPATVAVQEPKERR
ncbi:hypothetical protein Pen02_19230 [Plantactinospora endophytica]|uniref:Uncharacterized protein n=1 Tax=Plantactinospora endophytica TaxID=673535 RepID=A0ABQ4DY00_9ACTN|nr:hypothetical protein Pen02_19230 [Plantactinospora endophytica]